MDISGWDLLKFGWSVVLPHNWYLHKKLDKVSAEYIRREEFNKTIESIRNTITASNSEVTHRLDALLTTLLKTK